MKNPSRWLAAAVILGVVAACTQATATPSPSASTAPSTAPSADNRRVELTFMGWSLTGDILAAYEEFAAAFPEQEPRVTKVVVQTEPFVRYHDVLNVRIAAGKPPDVAHIFFALAPAYVDSSRWVRDVVVETIREKGKIAPRKEGRIMEVP